MEAREWLSRIPQSVLTILTIAHPAFTLLTPFAEIAQGLIKKTTIIDKSKKASEKALKKAIDSASFVIENNCIDEIIEILFSIQTSNIICFHNQDFKEHFESKLYEILDKYEVPYREQSLDVEAVILSFFSLLDEYILNDEELRDLDTNIKVTHIYDEISKAVKEIEDIKAILLYDSLHPIYFDHGFIKDHKVDSNCSAVTNYFNINDDINIIAKVVSSNFDIKNNSLIDVIKKQINDTQNEPLFILGNGGVGKTTAIFRIAADYAYERPVFFIRLKNEQISEEKINNTLKHIDNIANRMGVSALLIIDNPYVNAEFVGILHNRLANDDLNIKPVLVERLNRMDILMSDRTLYDWYENANIVLVSGQEAINTDKLKWIKSEKTSNCVIDSAWNKAVLQKMMELILTKGNIDRDILIQSFKKNIQQHNNDKLSIAEQRYRIIYEYNKSVKDNKIPSCAPIKFDWDEWNDLFKKNFSRSDDTFIYLAALYLFKIPMRIETLANITDIPVNQLQNFLDKNLNKGLIEPVQYIDNKIYLKHDIIADLFFDFYRDRYSVQTYLKRIINSKMDEETAVIFEKVVFTKKNITGEIKVPFDIDTRALLLEFGENMGYLNALEKKERLYSYDLAVAWSKNGDEKQNELKKLLAKYKGHIRVYMAFLNEQRKIGEYEYLINELPIPVINNDNVRDVDSYGRLMLRLGKTKEAADIFRSITDFNEYDLQSRMALAGIYKQNREYEKAEDIYKYILKYINKNNLPTLRALAFLYIEMEGRKAEAEEMFKAILQIDCNNLNNIFSYGKILRINGNNIEAEKQFLRCLEINNRHHQSINELGMLYGHQKRFSEAIDMFESALEIQGPSIPTLVAYGNLLIIMEYYDKAAEKYNEALKINENEYKALYGLALISRNKGTEETIKKFTDLHEKFPNEEDPLTNLGSLYYSDKDYQTALKYFNKALKINRNNTYALHMAKKIKEGLIREYPLFSLCGLNCGLCPRFHTEGSSKCPGCGGPDFKSKHPSCSVVYCNKKRDNVEFCFQCFYYPCKKYSGISETDSFITYKNVIADFEKAKSSGIEIYMSELNEKIDILRFMLDNYNDGRKKNFYCIAVNLLSITALREIKGDIDRVIAPKDIHIKEKIEHVVLLFEDKANKENIKLVLRK